MLEVPVLDGKGFVGLYKVSGRDVIGHESDELDMVTIARASRKGSTRGFDADRRLLSRLVADNHASPTEFVNFTFLMDVPLVCWIHVWRHRTGKFSMQSFRYTEAEEDEFYVPTAWRAQSEVNKQASIDNGIPKPLQESLSQSLEEHIADSMTLYKMALGNKVAREQARFFLPAYALMMQGYVQFDARNLWNFFKQRTAEDAQFETREVAKVMLRLAEEALPHYSAEMRKRDGID